MTPRWRWLIPNTVGVSLCSLGPWFFYWTRSWEWHPYNHLSCGHTMSNLLTPKGICPQQKCHPPPHEGWKLPTHNLDPVPSWPGPWIIDDWGPCQLCHEATGRGVGIPKSWDVAGCSLVCTILSEKIMCMVHFWLTQTEQSHLFDWHRSALFFCHQKIELSIPYNLDISFSTVTPQDKVVCNYSNGVAWGQH